MGGNLFKLGRIPRQRYLEIEQEIRNHLDQVWPGLYRIPRYYDTKADFGDLDVIVSEEVIVGSWVLTRQKLLDELGITQYKSAGNVFSTVYRNFQVDYFLTPPEYLESTYQFLSFNDLGNLIGKICRRFNLKYGEKGLLYVFRRQNGHYKKELEVSKDFRQICAFLDLDYDHWLQGFASLEDMFDWVIASRYFSVQPYQEQALALSKKAEQRTTIQKFVNYLEEKKIERVYSYLSDKNDYLPAITEAFPKAHLLEQIKLEKEAEKRADKIHEKFNGNLIKTLKPELEKEALGKFIIEFKNAHPDFEEFILHTSITEIQEKILNFKL